MVLEEGRFAAAHLVPTVQVVLERFPDVAVVGVDIPIGLPEAGVRAADVAAREFVGPLRSSVFRTPPRRVVEKPTYAEALEECRRSGLPGVSAQAYALRRKILEVDGLALADRRIVEVHPEVSFAEMAGRPLDHPKATWNGLVLRRSLLVAKGVSLPDEVAVPAPAADLLDAAAAAWSAHRYALGRALPLPPESHERLGTIWR